MNNIPQLKNYYRLPKYLEFPLHCVNIHLQNIKDCK